MTKIQRPHGRLCLRVIAITVALVMAILLTGCGKRSDKEIKIGFICSYQEVSNKYPEILWGMELAAEDLNRKYGGSGYNISFEIFDDKGKTDEALSQANKLLGDDSIDYIMVMSSDERLDKAAEKLANGKKITFWLDDAGQVMRSAEYKNQFFLTYNLSDRAEALASHLAENEIENLGVLYSAKGYTSELGQSLIEEAGNRKIHVDSQVVLSSFSTDELKEKLKTEKPQAVAVMSGNADDNAKIIRAVKTVLPDCLILTDYSVDSLEVLEKNKWLLEGAIIPSNIKTDWNEGEIKDITQRYEALYNQGVQSRWFSHGYFSLTALADASVYCGTTNPRTVQKYFTSASSHRYNFNEAGMMLFDKIPVLEAKQGVFEDIEG